MPTCSATRRASYTSSSEQQRPVAASVCNSGSRRWFQSCIVIPTMERPSRTRSAAAVELSTPPLIATAMGCVEISGMDRDPPEVRDGCANRVGERVDLFDGVAAAQREAHAGARAIIAETDAGEHVRGRERAAGAGRARGHGEAAQVERDNHSFAIDTVEVDVAGVRRAMRA